MREIAIERRSASAKVVDIIDEREKGLRGQVFYSREEAIEAVGRLLNFERTVGPPYHETNSCYYKIDCGWVDDTAICLLYVVHQESDTRNYKDNKSTGHSVVLRFYEFRDTPETVPASRYDLPRTRRCFRINTLCAITRKSGYRPDVRPNRLSARNERWVERCVAEARELRKSLYLRLNVFEFEEKMQKFAVGIDGDRQKRSPVNYSIPKRNPNGDFCPFTVEPPLW